MQIVYHIESLTILYTHNIRIPFDKIDFTAKEYCYELNISITNHNPQNNNLVLPSWKLNLYSDV